MRARKSPVPRVDTGLETSGHVHLGWASRLHRNDVKARAGQEPAWLSAEGLQRWGVIFPLFLPPPLNLFSAPDV